MPSSFEAYRREELRNYFHLVSALFTAKNKVTKFLFFSLVFHLLKDQMYAHISSSCFGLLYLSVICTKTINFQLYGSWIHRFSMSAVI